MEGAHPDYIALSERTARDIARTRRQRRTFLLLALIIPAAALVALVITIARAT